MVSPRSSANVPDFLIIGAMKAGTTSLYRDLAGHPELFLPEEKEPESLVCHGDDLRAIEQDYGSLFKRAQPGQLKGEASTAYTKRPEFEGVAQRALEVCGPGLKLIYLTRDPIRRIVSQFEHEFGYGLVTEPLNEAVLLHERFVSISRYQWQLQPWEAAFGPASLLQLSFEKYTSDRAGVAAEVCRFLGIDPHLLPPIQQDRAFNASKNKPTANRGLSKAILASSIYQRTVKPLVPWELRDRLASLMLPRGFAVNDVLEPNVEALLRARLEN